MHKIYLGNTNPRFTLENSSDEEGFALIELVVVVAVLAILAAIAIPSFTSINQEARVASAKTILANIAKECAVKLAGSGSDLTYIIPTADTYTFTSSGSTTGACEEGEIYTMTDPSGDLPTFRYSTLNGEKTCLASSNGLNALGCDTSTTPGAADGTW